MSDANLTLLTRYKEISFGVNNGTPSGQKVRITSESFNFNRTYSRSEEIRDDRIPADSIHVGQQSGGGFAFELSYASQHDEIEAAMYSAWQNAPALENDTADSTITQVTDLSDTFTVASGGTAFKANHLIKTTGFTNAANNSVLKVASSTATTVVVTTSSLTDEAAPPSGARIKVVGFQGNSGDITATATGLASTSLNFTTLGLVPGQWIKIGGTAAASQFATTALNTYVRVKAIAANALTLDNLPSAWATDTGASKEIKVWFGDYVRPGKTQTSFTYEKSNQGHSVIEYEQYIGVVPGTMQLTFEVGRPVTGSFEFLGKDATIEASPLDATPSDAPITEVMNATNDLALLAIDGGDLVSGFNKPQRLSLTLNNNQRANEAMGTRGLVKIGVGEAEVSGDIRCYFDNQDIKKKFIANQESSVTMVAVKEGQAMVFNLPNIRFENVDTAAPGKNQDQFQNIQFFAEKDDAVSGTHFQIDRLEYYE